MSQQRSNGRIQFAPIPSDSNQIRNALPSDRALQFVSMARESGLICCKAV
jgi:hypothetical protein